MAPLFLKSVWQLIRSWHYFSCLMLGDRYTILEAVEKSGKTVEEILELLK